MEVQCALNPWQKEGVLKLVMNHTAGTFDCRLGTELVEEDDSQAERVPFDLAFRWKKCVSLGQIDC